MRSFPIGLAMTSLLVAAVPASLRAQDEDDPRPREGPPKLEAFETDADADGIPDGWYNLRDARMVRGGIGQGKFCLRFENDRPGRPARVSRAFGVDGQEVEALVIGLWVRVEGVRTGPRLGEDPGLLIDFLEENRVSGSRGSLGPWTRTVGERWTRVAKRIPVPPSARDAIMSIGLLGATGVLEVDALTIDLVPRGGREASNLLRNGGVELGDPEPAAWLLKDGARRVFPGHRSASCLELGRAGSKALIGVSVPVERFSELVLTLAARGTGLRGAGGAEAVMYFLDADGEPLRGPDARALLLRWPGSFPWREERAPVVVPPRAAGAVLQFEKSEAGGTLWIDDVALVASPDPTAGVWTPDHVEDDTGGWLPYAAAPAILPGSALDASTLLDAPAGKRGSVVVRDGRLAFEDGGRARFFGVVLLPPTAFQEPKLADSLADRLARSGVNLVRLGDLDIPLGSGRSLIDDTRDDTRALDPTSLGKLDHLIASLKRRGIGVALELMSARRFRAGDGFPAAEQLRPGGGPAAAFDPVIRARALEHAEALLGHVNPETGLALRDDPVLAWVTLAGELSLFDLLDDPDALPPDSAEALKALGRKARGAGRRFWQATESAQWRAEADALREFKLRVPIAGVSHWRREPEFAAGQAGEGLDLLDDRLYWSPPTWADPGRRSLLWSTDGGLLADATRKRRPDRPYAVGQWCAHTEGAWALPYEGADLLLAAWTARAEDWDGLLRRGVFLYPEAWGSAATGTGGGDDLFVIPESMGGNPQVFALLPHAASLLLRGQDDAQARPGGRARPRLAVPGWDPRRGRLVVDTPFTQALAGWPGGQPAATADLVLDADSPYAVVAATSLGREPIARARRLLVTALARIQPTGFRWADHLRNEVADPGRPPLLQEPVRAQVTWKRSGKIKAYALDNSGARGEPVKLKRTADGVRLVIDGQSATVHWELVVE